MTIEIRSIIVEVGSWKDQEPMRYFDSLFWNFYLQYGHALCNIQGKTNKNKRQM